MPGAPGSGEQVRGIVGVGGNAPRARLRRSDVAGFLGSGGRSCTRDVASHDEMVSFVSIVGTELG